MHFFSEPFFLLFFSFLCYLLSSWLMCRSCLQGSFAAQRGITPTLTTMFLGVVAQTLFLLWRGGQEKSCPLHSLGEVFVFISWSLGLFYLVIGSTYRISLLGNFTAPLSLLLQGAAFFFPLSSATPITPLPPAIEGHAALSLLAFGALGLGAIAGVMFLIQTSQLKSQNPAPLFYQLPAMTLLAKVTKRLIVVGIALLSVSFLLALMGGVGTSGIKSLLSLILWGSYCLLLLGHHFHYLSGRRFAWGTILFFLIALLLLPGIEALSHF